MSDAPPYELSDRYRLRHGSAFMSGVQALARIPIEQLRVDRDEGLNTAAFVSGYQGSPLGGFDQEMARAARLVEDLEIVCRPAVNEELAAAAVMGTQLAAEQPMMRYDGVLGIWYGKAPGLDRASDALRHAAFAGTSRYGGAVALVGDDPAAKSSTLPSSSDATLVDLHMPMLYPGDVQEVLDLGRHAVAVSRLTGSWSAMKIVTAVADGTSTVDLSKDRVRIVAPDLTPPGQRGGAPYVHHPDAMLLAPRTLELERDFREVRTELIRRYVAANGLNCETASPGDAWIGLVASGYTYHQMIDALARLGLRSEREIESAGIRMLKMQMPLSVDRDLLRQFARGLVEIVVVEEKNPTLELLVKDALYNSAQRPQVHGKRHPDGRVLMTELGLLDSDAIMGGLRERLSPRLEDRLAALPGVPPSRARTLIPMSVERSPYFCSGCPHNRSTRVPEGSLVGGGIGCHTMVLLMDDERLGDVCGITAMGGEGAQWIGMAPFVDTPHFFQNLGDGTFFHSGQLAVQASVAAGTNITYKLLYNGTVAMTGGQDAVGSVGVPEVATILLAHGVKRVLVTTDDLDRYHRVDLAAGVDVWDRTRFEEAEVLLAGTAGVTVLIHDQACAAHNRHLRRRGVIPQPKSRIAINHRICEGCGDCGVVSNCLSVQPLETPLGRKTTIDQDTCNVDLSCLEGDCPSFMVVTPASRNHGSDTPTAAALPTRALPQPIAAVEPTGRFEWSVRLAGIGGTGVVTTAQIIGTAAMLDGLEVRGLDQTGLSQKAGPVVSDLRLARGQAPATNSIGAGGCDVVVALDLLVGSTERMLAVADPVRTRLVASVTVTPTGSMVGHPDRAYPTTDSLIGRGAARVMADPILVDAGAVTRRLLGSTAGSNIFMVGVALQSGALPIRPESIERAIALNGIAVEANVAAFRWGRWFVVDPSMMTDLLSAGPTVSVPRLPPSLGRQAGKIGSRTGTGALLELLAADLVGYQDRRYAARFLAALATLDEADSRAGNAVDPALMETAARSLHKLMAYKDEYEVARLLVMGDPAAESVGGPGSKVVWKLHPPVFAALGMDRKISVPAGIGRPAMKVLAAGRRLRGTAADPFGRAAVRKVERAMVDEILDAVARIATRLNEANRAEAIELLASADDVRGYEELKLRRAAQFRRGLAAGLEAAFP